MSDAREKRRGVGAEPEPLQGSPVRRALAAPAALDRALPQCRAGWTRHLLEGLQNQPPALAQRAREAVPARHLRQLEESIAVRWLPFDVHMSVLGALRATLGPHVYRRLCRHQIFASLHLPYLFAKPARAALQWRKVGPFAVFRAVPLSLRYIFRNAGESRLQVSPDGGQLRLSYEGLPPAYSRGDTWSLIWIATIEAIAAYALQGQALRAKVALTHHEPERGYFEWHASLVPSWVGGPISAVGPRTAAAVRA